jgi:polar amino acid transport system permease protein
VVGTTSLAAIEDVVQPEQEPAAFDTNDVAKTQLQNGQVDGIVVDLPTAFYITAAELDDGVIVGQLPATDGGEQDEFGIVLGQGQPADRLRDAGGRRAARGRHAGRAGGGVPRRRGRARAGVTGPTSAGGDLVTPQPPSLLPRRFRQGRTPPARPVSDLQRSREAYRRRQSRRSAVIAAVSTLVVLGGLLLLITSLPRWPLVQERFFDLDVARESLPDVARGLLVNLRLLLFCGVAITLLGLLVAVSRTLQGPVWFPVRLLAAAFTDVFRGLPLILLILLLGLGVPGLRLGGIFDSSLVWGGVALVLSYSAYVAEVFRAGIESVHPSQRMAARSLGLGAPQTLRYVVLPQAVRRVYAPLLNDLVSLMKDSGLVSLLGVATDAVRAASIDSARSFNYTPYVVAGVLFLLLTIPLTRLTDAISYRASHRRGPRSAV